MTTSTGNGCEGRILELIIGAFDQANRSGVAEQATAGHLVGEVQPPLGFIAGRQIPFSGLLVKRNRGLEKIFADSNKIAVTDLTGSDAIGHWISCLQSWYGDAMFEPFTVVPDGNRAVRELVINSTIGLKQWVREGPAHCRAQKCRGLLGVTAATLLSGIRQQGQDEESR